MPPVSPTHLRVATREGECERLSKCLLPLAAVVLIALWTLSVERAPSRVAPSFGSAREPAADATRLATFKRGGAWEREGWDEPPANGTCRVTKFMPFKIGCPISCCHYRQDPAVDQSPPMYRFGLVWDFGRLFPEMHDYDALTQAFSKPRLEDALNLTAATIRTFAEAENLLTSRVPSDLKPKVQTYAHLALSYLCCLTKDEATEAADFAREWIQRQRRQRASVPFHFDRLECWKERIDSVTNILVADPVAQRTLKLVEADLREHLAAARGGLLRSVFETTPTRHEQMPYHVTLLGLAAQRDNNLEASQPGNVSNFIPDIAHAVDQVNDHLRREGLIGDSKTGSKKTTTSSLLNYANLRTAPVACHANCDIDHS